MTSAVTWDEASHETEDGENAAEKDGQAPRSPRHLLAGCAIQERVVKSAKLYDRKAKLPAEDET